MASLKDITTFLDDMLEISAYPQDNSNNGLQYQGCNEVSKAVFAVDASEAVFTIAADLDADFIFVHHGISWGSGLKRITGLASKRLALLAANGMSLYAAHLPLDAHDLIGHNALLSGMLNLKNLEPFGTYAGTKIGFRGTLPKPMKLADIAAALDKKLPSEGDFDLIGNTEDKISNVAVISGGGAWPGVFEELYDSNAECLITGAFGHEAFHYAMESGTSVISLGHYRSETPGVIAVMNSIAEKFGIETEFVDIPTGL